jgi:iron complex transport system ATP-binding protein
MPAPITPVLSFSNLHFSRAHSPILSNISWQVLPGQIAAILGPNGSGKSTLLRLASGYLWPHTGAVQLLGQTLGSVPLAPLRARIGIVEATTLYPFDDDLSAQDVVLTGYFSSLTLGFHKLSRARAAHAAQLLDQVGLPGRAAQPYATLSTGERLRCLLARALVRKPDLLLLDEPTAGIDLPARESILATLSRLHAHSSRLKSQGSSLTPPSIITITHHLEELLPHTSNILLLSSRGTTVATGAPRRVLTSRNLSTSFGIPIHVSHRHHRYHAHVNPTTWPDLLLPHDSRVSSDG